MIQIRSFIMVFFPSIIEDPSRIPRPTVIETRTRPHSIHSSHCSRWAIARVSVLVYASRSSKTFFHSSRSLNSSHWHSSHSFRSVHSSHCHCPRWATAWVSVLETVCVPAYPFCARHFRSFPAFHTFWGSRFSAFFNAVELNSAHCFL